MVFGMKTHIGVNADSGLVYSVESTTAEAHDSKVVDELLHGEECDVHGDKVYANEERNLLNSNPESRTWCMPLSFRNDSHMWIPLRQRHHLLY